MCPRAFAGAVIVGAVGCVQGCGFSVTPPADPADPVSVFIADHGIHTSLLLPRPREGAMARSPAEADAVAAINDAPEAGDGSRVAQYAYSQFNWAALDQDQWYRSVFALMIPADGTIGTRDFSGPATSANLTHQFEVLGRHPPLQTLYEIRVERSSRDRLLAELDGRWSRQSASKVTNQKRGLVFVRDATSYSLGHNCNHMVAGWLRELGCEVRGSAMTADITIEGPGLGRP